MSTCPQCDGGNIEQTAKFDLTLVETEEARHDFECLDCRCLFQIVYRPVARKIIERDCLTV